MNNIEELKKNPKTSFLTKEYERLSKEEEEIRKMMKDIEMKELAENELSSVMIQKEAIEKQIQEIILSEKEEEEFPNEIIIEVRAGAGGDEASIFAEDLSLMYQKFAEFNGWSFKKIDESRNSLGGYKEVIFEIRGKDVYKKCVLKQECIVFKEFLPLKNLEEYTPQQHLLLFCPLERKKYRNKSIGY